MKTAARVSAAGNRRNAATLAGVASLACLLASALSGPASAQAPREEDRRIPDMARRLQEAAPCSALDADDRMAAVAASLKADPHDVLVALGMVAGSPDLCASLRQAADELRGTYAGIIASADIAAPAPTPIADAPEPRPDTSAEDRARVQQLQFEIGPPPRRLTRGAGLSS